MNSYVNKGTSKACGKNSAPRDNNYFACQSHHCQHKIFPY